MLHTLTDSGHMAWTCLCGDERMAHISHTDVTHPSQDEYISEVEGTSTDEQGRTWTRHITRPTGRKIVDASLIALPRCDCGKRTFLKVSFTPEELANVSRDRGDTSGIPTDASVDAALRHMALARQMINAGKGPTP